MVFENDGSWRAFYDTDPGNPFDFGRYELENDVLTLASSTEVKGSPCAGAVGTYEVVFEERPTAIRFPASGAEDACEPRKDDMVSITFMGVGR